VGGQLVPVGVLDLDDDMPVRLVVVAGDLQQDVVEALALTLTGTTSLSSSAQRAVPALRATVRVWLGVPSASRRR
jgi:hypothetical protein